MADSLEEQMNAWLSNLSKLVVINDENKSAITKAGADVFRDALEDETRKKHYSHHDDKVYGHMADHIVSSNKDVDGRLTGKSTVGWPNQYHALNALRLNDGTIKIKPDHFVTNLRENQKVQQAILSAEKAKYDELTKGDGN